MHWVACRSISSRSLFDILPIYKYPVDISSRKISNLPNNKAALQTNPWDLKSCIFLFRCSSDLFFFTKKLLVDWMLSNGVWCCSWTSNVIRSNLLSPALSPGFSRMLAFLGLEDSNGTFRMKDLASQIGGLWNRICWNNRIEILSNIVVLFKSPQWFIVMLSPGCSITNGS